MIVNVPVNIPDWLIEPLVQIVILYRRLRYGCAFRKIPLTQGKFAIVDPDDYHRLKKYKWHLHKSPSNFYAGRSISIAGKGGLVLMHREILKVQDNLCVDHINRNGLDNRKANLRPATRTQNQWNRQTIPHTSKFKGVSWNKSHRKWRASIGKERKVLYLGCYDSEIKAAEAYDEAAKNCQGQFAVLNFED